MKGEKAEEVFVRLYEVIEIMQMAIESSMDHLLENRDTKEFDKLLLELAELSIKLLKRSQIQKK